jgi:chromosome segregation ATPase
MGLSALVVAGRSVEESACGNVPLRMTELLDRITTLIDESDSDLDRIERTLTDGYAHALSLEGERRRLEQRLSQLARELHDGDTATKTDELSSVARQLDGNAGDLTRLRSALAELRRHAAGVR